jgi:hypothetical protein
MSASSADHLRRQHKRWRARKFLGNSARSNSPRTDLRSRRPIWTRRLGGIEHEHLGHTYGDGRAKTMEIACPASRIPDLLLAPRAVACGREKKNINPQPATSARPRDFLSYQVANSYACTYRIKLGYGKFFVVRPTALALRRCRCASHHTFTESVGFINNYVSIFNDLSATLPAWHDFGSFRQRRSPQLHPS